ncbi:hypothetical protein LCGC14_1874350 [marine sediment metagenome]|uniref:Roadblock/LAMTOR2 domain-containing protein n=1 Tax=marine sediment metagenome TaxID=412755 RepID=A0A0F9II37_9ZZZZ
MFLEMSQDMDDEGKLVSMLLEANKDVRYACICDSDGKILWNSRRNDIKSLMTLEETKASLKRACENWKDRDKLSAKIGKGKFAIVGYEKIKRITVPLKNNHMLFLSVEGDKPEYIGDILKIVKYVEEHPSQK